MGLDMKKAMKWTGAVLAMGALGLGVTGCHSRYIEADVKNESGAAVSLVEVDYPSASFGKEALADGAVYHYKFKILGDGPTKILWTDAKRQDHSVGGPSLQEGQEGTLTITITETAAVWQYKAAAVSGVQ